MNQQQIGGAGGPQIKKVTTTDGKLLEVCSNCGTPVPGAHSFQDGSNKIWSKRSCPSCQAIFSLEGPFPNHQTANPTVFK